MKKDAKLKLMKFGATWCGPCRTLAKSLDGFDAGIEIQSIDVDLEPELCNKFNIRGVPTLVIFDENNEREIDRKVGLISPEALRGWIEDATKTGE